MGDTQMIKKNNNLAETDEIGDLLSSLPKEKSWRTGCVYRYQGFWCPEKQVPALRASPTGKLIEESKSNVAIERLAVRDNYCTVHIMDDTQMITKNNNLTETDELADLLSSLPKEKSWRSGYLYRYQGFWCPEKQVPAVIAFQKHFLAQKTDMIIVTMPKSGTTWLKALAFSIMNRAKYTPSSSPLNSVNPHDLVPFCEYGLYANIQIPDLSTFPSPRMFATHVPYPSLPDSVKDSGCRIVYLCRNPFDNFISSWHFASKARDESLGPLSLEDCFDGFCNGLGGFGPFFDHVLGYWRESLKRPDEVLFLAFEDMKEDIHSQMKRLAEFLGCPFSLEEEADGVVEEISKMCSFSILKDKEINKTGRFLQYFETKTLFRRGEVGDWVNYLTPEMVDRMNKIMEQKLAGSGLKFKTG